MRSFFSPKDISRPQLVLHQKKDRKSLDGNSQKTQQSGHGWISSLIVSLNNPYHPRMAYIYPHLVEFYGKCGEIYHTWILWVIFCQWIVSGCRPSWNSGIRHDTIHRWSDYKGYTVPMGLWVFEYTLRLTWKTKNRLGVWVVVVFIDNEPRRSIKRDDRYPFPHPI